MKPENITFSSPDLDARITAGILEHRTSEAVLRVVDDAGRPLPGVVVEVEQTSSDFLFGANIFMLNGYREDRLNARYEQAFLELFNAASVPVFWKDIEPQRGQFRFTADSAPIRRRPPLDTLVDYCERHKLNMNANCLAWDYRPFSLPTWLEDTTHCAPLLENYIHRVCERYGHRIHRWEPLNEALAKFHIPENFNNIPQFPKDYERLAFEWANRYLPGSASLTINETTPTSWDRALRPDYLRMIDRLRQSGARIDNIGLQFHMFLTADIARLLTGEIFTPRDITDALDDYHRVGLPVYISEITLPAVDGSAQAQADQARLARHYYRLLFSHPAVRGITWWNLPDAGAVEGHESTLASGLLNADLTPKPAYEALHQLIRSEWRTRLTVNTDASGEARFRGFHGSYQIRVQDHHFTRALPADTGVLRIDLELGQEGMQS